MSKNVSSKFLVKMFHQNVSFCTLCTFNHNPAKYSILTFCTFCTVFHHPSSITVYFLYFLASSIIHQFILSVLSVLSSIIHQCIISVKMVQKRAKMVKKRFETVKSGQKGKKKKRIFFFNSPRWSTIIKNGQKR